MVSIERVLASDAPIYEFFQVKCTTHLVVEELFEVEAVLFLVHRLQIVHVWLEAHLLEFGSQARVDCTVPDMLHVIVCFAHPVRWLQAHASGHHVAHLVGLLGKCERGPVSTQREANQENLTVTRLAVALVNVLDDLVDVAPLTAAHGHGTS